jgi:hypothetical protein
MAHDPIDTLGKATRHNMLVKMQSCGDDCLPKSKRAQGLVWARIDCAWQH